MTAVKTTPSARWKQAFALIGAIFLSCSDSADLRREVIATPGIVPMTDLNDLPQVVEVSLIASIGEAKYLPTGAAQVWGYRDGAKEDSKVIVPGPLIEANQGDKVIVHFRNELPEGTTIHWHGVRVPNAADGTPSTQVEVAPGGEYRYEFTVGDEGTFWYHPHVRSDVQIERGLHGMLLVHGGPRVPVRVERALVLDDVKLNATGTLSDATTSLDIMLGRLGNFLLVNGIVNGRIDVDAGSRERWRIVNVANGRYFNLRLSGHVFTVVGWDGGMLSKPYPTETLLIAPGERYDVLVELHGKAGSSIPLETLHYDRGHEIPDPGPLPMVHLSFSSAAARQEEPLPPVWGATVNLQPSLGTAEIQLELAEEPLNGGEDVRFFINGKAFPDGLMLQGRPRELVVWRVHNASEMDHPFHVHGAFFRVLDSDGLPPERLGWKDTVNVPRGSTLRIAVEYPESGRWMFHCHILEHAERGMMGELRIVPVGADWPSDAPLPGRLDGGIQDAGAFDANAAEGEGGVRSAVYVTR